MSGCGTENGPVDQIDDDETGAVMLCGNGVLDPDEVCDAALGAPL